MFYLKQPASFDNPIEVVGCFVECDGKILELKRHPNKAEGLMYGRPGGKINKEDLSNKHAIAREVFEETGLQIDLESFKDPITFYVTHDNSDRHFIYYNYRVVLDYLPEVKLSEAEHIDFLWTTPKDALKLCLMPDEDNCLKSFYGIK